MHIRDENRTLATYLYKSYNLSAPYRDVERRVWYMQKQNIPRGEIEKAIRHEFAVNMQNITHTVVVPLQPESDEEK